MNKMFFYTFSFLLIFAYSFLYSQPTRAGTVFTNVVDINASTYMSFQTNLSLTVGPIYGLSELVSSSNYYIAYPAYQLRIPFSITNNGNDADSNAQIFVEFLSNNPGYMGTNWEYSIEVSSVTQGTNYSIPYANFGEGAIFNFNLVVYVPAACPIGSDGFFRVTVATVSNSSHIAAPYVGYNGISYGGNDVSSKEIQVHIIMPNQIRYVFATDGIDTIDVFNGTYGLRRSQNSIFVELYNDPFDPGSLYLWYAIDSMADGSIGPNPNDFSTPMRQVGTRQFRGDIPGNMLGQGTYVSFIFEIDGITYTTNWTYRLLSLGQQEGYETVIMNNIIDYKEDDYIYLKLPDKVMGKEGKVMIYSVSADHVITLLNGRADTQILKWNGKDKTGSWVAKGMYFIVVDFAEVKEVRKCFVK